MRVSRKLCGRCGCVRERIHFFKDVSKPSGLQSWCVDCKLAAHRMRLAIAAKQPREPCRDRVCR